MASHLFFIFNGYLATKNARGIFFISSQNGIICSVKDKLFIEENCVYTESILAFVIMLLKLILCPLNSSIFGNATILKPHLIFYSKVAVIAICLLH